MDGQAIADTLVSSASAIYDYLEAMQYVSDPPLGVSMTEATSVDVRDGYAVLHLEAPLNDTSGIMLMVGSEVMDEGAAGFTRYDEISRTIVVRPGDEVLGTMGDPAVKVRVLTDMKFLIAAVGEFYRRYGGRLTLPIEDPVSAEPEFPEGSGPTGSQVEAVSAVLSNRLSYVWGAPGTGKTQYVLATCIRACLEAGRRVAVFAPTNNSVEQVLHGILKAFEGVPGMTEGIIRLGVPTRAFLRDHPGMCEDRQAQRRMDQCMAAADNLGEVMYERCCDLLEEEVRSLARDASCRPADSDGCVMLRDNPDLRDRFMDLAGLFAMRPETRDLAYRSVRWDLRDVMSEMVTLLYDRDRPALDLMEYEDWEDSDVMAEIVTLSAEADSLRSRGTRDRLERARLIASTPQQFISRFRPKGTDEDGRMELDVDHIFLDEAGYCGLVQAAALFTNGVPVTLLGDHMQLPPVTQIDDEVVRAAAERGGRLSDAYLWGMSSLHAERLLRDGPGSLRRVYLDGEGPELLLTARADLTDSHRFGPNLARVLDRHVYRNGMTGSSEGGDLRMVCLDSSCDHREGRENLGEMRAIREYLRREAPDPGSVAILTPYTVQARLLRSRLGRAYRDSVMTVHGSQGREWDTVVFSVADNGVLSREVPFRFTSSSTETGKKVVNTAVSRARRTLVMVCDREFWLGREDELIGGLLREVPEDGVEVFRDRGPWHRGSA